MANPIPNIETERLLLRVLELSDAPAIQRVFPQWDVAKFLDDVVPWPYPDDGALRYVRDVSLPAMQNGTEWAWSIRLRSAPDQLIGVIHLTLRRDDNRGFWLDPAFRGQGLMTEAADAVTDFWFSVLKQPVLRVVKAIVNTGSRQISVRSRMRLIGTKNRDYVSGQLPSETWEMTREEWLASTHRPTE